jgi:hypothetical protein
MMQGTRRGGLVALLVIATAAVAFTLAGSEDEEPLRALREDPLGRYVPPGGRLVETTADPASDGGLLGKPAPARYDRLFRVPRATTLDDAARAARAAGWSTEEVLGGTGVTGIKRLDDGTTATMSIVRRTDALLIHLEHAH